MTNNYSGILFMLLRYSAHPRDGIKLSERLWVKMWYPGKLGIALLKHRLLKHQVARIGFNPIRLQQSDWIGCETSEFNFMKRRPRHPLHSKSITQRIHASLMHKGVATFALRRAESFLPFPFLWNGGECLRYFQKSSFRWGNRRRRRYTVLNLES